MSALQELYSTEELSSLFSYLRDKYLVGQTETPPSEKFSQFLDDISVRPQCLMQEIGGWDQEVRTRLFQVLQKKAVALQQHAQNYRGASSSRKLCEACSRPLVGLNARALLSALTHGLLEEEEKAVSSSERIGVVTILIMTDNLLIAIVRKVLPVTAFNEVGLWPPSTNPNNVPMRLLLLFLVSYDCELRADEAEVVL